MYFSCTNGGTKVDTHTNTHYCEVDFTKTVLFLHKEGGKEGEG